jgi:hypothetical protein
MPICNCEIRCRGGKEVTRKTYVRHKGFRESASNFSAEFGAFMTAASHKVNMSCFYAQYICLIYNA